MSETWEERKEIALKAMPELAGFEWSRALGEYELLGALLRELGRLQPPGATKGRRPPVDEVSGTARLAQIMGDDYTGLSFPEALQSLRAAAGGMSMTQLAATTGISRTVLHHLLAGDREPTLDQIALAAKGFGKQPWYFVEWRVSMLTLLLREHLTRSPETSMKFIRELGLGGIR